MTNVDAIEGLGWGLFGGKYGAGWGWWDSCPYGAWLDSIMAQEFLN